MLPPLPFRLPGLGCSHASLAWTHRSGEVVGAPFFMRDRGNRVHVGWAGFAGYDLHIDGLNSRVSATLEVDAAEAAAAFVFSVLPLTLPFWDLEPFHGSAVLTQRGALVVLGPSGSGKSSMASLLERIGFPLLADDTCAFDSDLMLWPGPAAISPRWADALQPPVGEYNEKAIRRPALHSSQSVRPAGVVVLEPHEGVAIEVIEPEPEGRMRAILANARHGTFLLERREALQFRVAAKLGRLPLVLVRIDPAQHGPEEIAQAVAGWMQHAGVATPGAQALVPGLV